MKIKKNYVLNIKIIGKAKARELIITLYVTKCPRFFKILEKSNIIMRNIHYHILGIVLFKHVTISTVLLVVSIISLLSNLPFLTIIVLGFSIIVLLHEIMNRLVEKLSYFSVGIRLTRSFIEDVKKCNVKVRDYVFTNDELLSDLEVIEVICICFDEFRKEFVKFFKDDVKYIELMCNIVKNSHLHSLKQLNNVLKKLLC